MRTGKKRRKTEQEQAQAQEPRLVNNTMDKYSRWDSDKDGVYVMDENNRDEGEWAKLDWNESLLLGRMLSFEADEDAESVESLISDGNHESLDGVIVLVIRRRMGVREAVEEGEPFTDEGFGDDHAVFEDELMDGFDEGFPVLEEGWDEDRLEGVGDVPVQVLLIVLVRGLR